MTALVVLTMIPAVFLTVKIVHQSVLDNNVNRFIKAELQQRGTQIISNIIDKDSLRLRVVAVGKEISEAHQQKAKDRMEFYGLKGYQLRVIQGMHSDSLMMLNNELTDIPAAAYYVSQTMEELDQVKGQAYVTSAITLGGVFSNLISGVILDHLGIKFMLVTGTTVCAVGVVIAYIAMNKLPHHTTGN